MSKMGAGRRVKWVIYTVRHSAMHCILFHLILATAIRYCPILQMRRGRLRKWGVSLDEVSQAREQWHGDFQTGLILGPMVFITGGQGQGLQLRNVLK